VLCQAQGIPPGDRSIDTCLGTLDAIGTITMWWFGGETCVSQENCFPSCDDHERLRRTVSFTGIKHNWDAVLLTIPMILTKNNLRILRSIKYSFCGNFLMIFVQLSKKYLVAPTLPCDISTEMIVSVNYSPKNMMVRE